MRKTIKQLESEIEALKQEVEATKLWAKTWQDAHAAALKALAAEIKNPGPVWIGPSPHYAPYTTPLNPLPLPWYTITCSNGTLTGSTDITGASLSIGEVVKVSS